MSKTLSYLPEELRAKVSAWRAGEVEWTTLVRDWPLTFSELLDAVSPDGWSGKTYLASSVRAKVKTSRGSSKASPNSGMAFAGEFLTLNTSDWPSDASVCSLSDILETGDLPQRYFLSPKACQGILRRAAKRGKELPPKLRQALEAVAQVSQEPETVEAKTP